jgi:hypothetical protein
MNARVRGTVETFDGTTGRIKAENGREYGFHKTAFLKAVAIQGSADGDGNQWGTYVEFEDHGVHAQFITAI